MRVKGATIRRIAARAGWFALGALATVLVLYGVVAGRKRDERPWHRFVPRGEFRHGARGAPTAFAGYLELERRLFEELRRFAQGAGRDPSPLGRYNPDGPTCPLAFERDWNQSYVLGQAPARGGALLLHGLSDSPYTLLPVARLFEARGYRVVGLRLPGHGTVPAALREVDWLDWRDAVRLAAADLRREIGDRAPLVLVGYSNGAALALEHVLEALEGQQAARPDALVFLSPAFTVTRLAALARFQLWASELPGLSGLSWTSVLPEYDPYKYNSFALNAGRQIYRLTRRVDEGLTALEQTGRIGELPPALTFQSVADSTVPPLPSLRTLYGRISGNGSQVVLFDVNRLSRIEMFRAPDSGALLERAESGGPFDFDVTVVTNRDRETTEVVARTRDAGSSAWRSEPLGLAWPPGVYSLSHVAVPFPLDDPIYGAGEPTGGPFPFGGLEPRGERGGLVVPVELLMRLRYNPFFSYLAARLDTFLDRIEGDVSQKPVSGTP